MIIIETDMVVVKIKENEAIFEWKELGEKCYEEGRKLYRILREIGIDVDIEKIVPKHVEDRIISRVRLK